MQTRVCIDCKEEKGIYFFPVSNGEWRRTRCQDCYRVYNNARKKSTYVVSKNRERTLRRFNMTIEDYEKMHAEQDGVCAICGKPETRLTKEGVLSSLAVDHDHACCEGDYSCGQCVRGLLCFRCNMMLGYAGDNIAILHLATKYLSEGLEI